MSNPFDRAVGGVNSRLYVDGVYVGLVQNANFNRVFQKVAVNEVGSHRTREHVVNGVVCTISIGWVFIQRSSLEAQGVLYPTNEDEIRGFLAKTYEFRTLDDELIIKAEGVTPSNDALQFSRDSIWGHNVNFDATWFYPAGAG